MSLDYVKFSNGFEKFMPKEYRDMVEHGPFGKKVSVSQMGSFKEVFKGHKRAQVRNTALKFASV